MTGLLVLTFLAGLFAGCCLGIIVASLLASAGAAVED
jgi:hypothetical protein